MTLGADEPEQAVRAAGAVQPLWAHVPVAARARYVRAAARVILDDLDALAELIVREAGLPLTEAVTAELLPSAEILRRMADDGPGALADRRAGPPALLRAGRRALLVHEPLGVIAVNASGASPWLAAAERVGAALLAGNAVVLIPDEHAPGCAERVRLCFERAGVPVGIVRTIAAGTVLDARAHGAGPGPRVARVLPRDDPRAWASMLVLEDALTGQAVAGALWGAFARCGCGPAAIKRVVVVGGRAGEFRARLAAGARALRVGDPALPETEAGLLRPADAGALERAIAASEADLLCGGRRPGAPGDTGVRFAPAVLAGPEPAEPPAGPAVWVLEVADEAAAMALCVDERPAGANSVWTRDQARGERVARALPGPQAWVNEHGRPAVGAAARLEPLVSTSEIAWRPSRLPSARRHPYDEALARAAAGVARIAHGREADRAAAVRASVRPVLRVVRRRGRSRPGADGPAAAGPERA